MAPPLTGAAVPAIKQEVDDSGDNAEINASRDCGARSTAFQSSTINYAPPLFVLTTEQSDKTRFPENCPVLYGFSSDGAEVRVREGIVRKVEMRADRRLEYRIESRSEVALRGQDKGSSKGRPTLDRATEEQMAYAIHCPVLVAGEEGASDGDQGEVLFANLVTEHGRVGMRYIVQYNATKEHRMLRMREGLTAEQLSYNLHCVANNEVGGSGGDGGGGGIAQKGKQTNPAPPTVVPLLHQNSAKGSINVDSRRHLGEPPKDQEGASENPPCAMSDRESFKPLGGGERREAVESVPTSIDVRAQVKAKDLSAVKNEQPDGVASRPAAEQNGLACHPKSQLPSVANAEDGARGASAPLCDESSHDRAPDPAFAAAVLAPYRQIKAELPVTSVYSGDGVICALCLKRKDRSHFSNKQRKSETPGCHECRYGKPSDTRQCADCKITKTRAGFSLNQWVNLYEQRRKSTCKVCLESRKGTGKKARKRKLENSNDDKAQSKGRTANCQECKTGKATDTRQCADCKITKTKAEFSGNQYVNLYAKRGESICIVCVKSRKAMHKEMQKMCYKRKLDDSTVNERSTREKGIVGFNNNIQTAVSIFAPKSHADALLPVANSVLEGASTVDVAACAAGKLRCSNDQ